MFERRWEFKETVLKIKSDTERGIKAAIKGGLDARRCVERFIAKYPEIRYSLEPLHFGLGDYPRVIELMLKASDVANVGPFAAVAGSISQVAAEAAIDAGASDIVVDNGGDISMDGRGRFRIGIYAGNSEISRKIGFLVQKEDLPIGICTSSGRIGHSMSLGDSDAVVVVADEASIADAAATSIANEVRGAEVESSVKRGLDRADEISEIRGCLISLDEYVGIKGKLPRLIPTRVKFIE